MRSKQTTESGGQLTLITGVGSQPATRESIERLCRTKSGRNHDPRSPRAGQH